MAFSECPPSIPVSWFGAKGDGVTDDAIGIQAALDAAGNTGGIVQLEPKRYYVQTPIEIRQHSTTLQGASIGASPYDYGSGSPLGTQIICADGSANLSIDSVGYARIKDLDIYLPLGATLACTGIDIRSAFLPKIDNVRVNNFSTGIKLNQSTDTYIEGCYIASLGCTVAQVQGIHIDGSAHTQNPSVYISNTISAHASYSGQAFGFLVNGNRINDVNFDACEAAGGTQGFVIDGSAGIDDGYGADIRFRGCVADACSTYGFHVTALGDNCMVGITDGWSAGAGTNIYVAGGSADVLVSGMQVWGGHNGIYFQNGSSGIIKGNILKHQAGNGVVLDNVRSCSVASNKGYQDTARGSNFIQALNGSTHNSYVSNVGDALVANGWGYGILLNAGCDYSTVMANIMRGNISNPYDLNLGSNVNTINLGNI